MLHKKYNDIKREVLLSLSVLIVVPLVNFLQSNIC